MKFKLQHKNGQTLTRRATDFFEFQSDLGAVPLAEIADYAFFIDNQPVPFEVAQRATQACIDAFIAQRALTHKQVWVRTGGVTNARANFSQRWIKKGASDE